MKKLRTSALALSLVGLLALGAAGVGAAQITADLRPDITVTVNGDTQTMLDKNGNIVHPITYNGTTYLPIRALGEVLGHDVDWDSKSQTVSLTAQTATPAVTTLDQAEARMQELAGEIDALQGADTYPQRARQYAAMSEKLDALRGELKDLAEGFQEDLRQGRMDYAAYRTAMERVEAVETRCKTAQTALEGKTIGHQPDTLTPEEKAAATLTSLEAQVAELTQTIQALSSGDTYPQRVKQYNTYDKTLTSLSRQVSQVYDDLNEDLRGGRLTYPVYNTLSGRADALDNQLKDARAALEAKTISKEDQATVPPAETTATHQGFVTRLEALATQVNQKVEEARRSQSGTQSERQAALTALNALERTLDQVEDELEAAYRGGQLTQSQYRGLESQVDTLEDTLDRGEDWLEDRDWDDDDWDDHWDDDDDWDDHWDD